MVSRVAGVDAELARFVAGEPPQTVTERREILRQVERLETAWRQSGGQRRRAIVRLLAVRVGLKIDEPPLPVWRSPEDLGVLPG